MSAQYLILALHCVSLCWSVYVIWKVELYRPFGVALALYSLVGLIYYSAILIIKIPGHDYSILRSGFQAAVWLAFGFVFTRRGR